MLDRHLVGGFVAAVLLAAAAPAHAQGKGEIVMGSWGGGTSETWREAAAKPFTEKTGIPVRITDWPDPEPTIRAQKGAQQYNMAVATYFNAANLYKDGLIETFTTDDVPALKDSPERYVMKGPDGKILGVGIYFQYYGIAYNTEMAKAAELQSWESLADPKWKGKLAVTRPIYASTYDLVLFAKIKGGDENNIEPGLPLFKALAGNSMAVYNSMAQMNTLLTRGEIAAGPYYFTRVWSFKRAGVKNVDIVLPKEGGLMLPYMLIVPKGAKNLEAAKAFLNYASMPETELRMLDRSGYIPLNTKAQLSEAQVKEIGMPLPALMDKLYQPDWNVVAAKQEERIGIVEQIVAKLQ